MWAGEMWHLPILLRSPVALKLYPSRKVQHWREQTLTISLETADWECGGSWITDVLQLVAFVALGTMMETIKISLSSVRETEALGEPGFFPCAKSWCLGQELAYGGGWEGVFGLLCMANYD